MDTEAVGNRTERRKEETKKRIIKTAMTLFHSQGFEAATMEQIAREADIARKTLYNYFPVKEAILIEWVQGYSKKSGPDLIHSLKQMPDTRTRIIEMLTKLLELAAKQKDIFHIYFAYRMHEKFQLREDQRIRSGVYDFVKEIVRLGQQAGELRADLAVEVIANHLELVLAVIVIDMVRGKSGSLLKRSIEENVDIFLGGVLNGGEPGDT